VLPNQGLLSIAFFEAASSIVLLVLFLLFRKDHHSNYFRSWVIGWSVFTLTSISEAALAITLIAPAIPMLFMGEEWGSKTPFPFFCGFEGELADAVRNGRRREYDWAYAQYGDDVPDPLALSTFQSAVLDWDSLNYPKGRKRLALVRDLLAIRRQEIVPRLAGAAFGEAHAADNGLLTARWKMGGGATLRLLANLSAGEVACKGSETAGTAIWGGEAGETIPAWSVFWRISAGN